MIRGRLDLQKIPRVPVHPDAAGPLLDSLPANERRRPGEGDDVRQVEFHDLLPRGLEPEMGPVDFREEEGPVVRPRDG